MRSPLVRTRSRTGTRIEELEPERYVFMEASLRWHYPGQVHSGRQRHRCPLSPLIELPRKCEGMVRPSPNGSKAVELEPVGWVGLRYSHCNPNRQRFTFERDDDERRVR